MSSEIERTYSETGGSETVDNRGVSAGVLADTMHERDDCTRLYWGRRTPTEKGDALGAGKIEFCETGSSVLSHSFLAMTHT